LLQLELSSGKEVIDTLRETYDEIYEINTSQGRHSRRLAEKSLKWVLCAARPLKIWGLGAAVAVDGEDKVTTGLIVDTCSNFFIVDSKGIVQLAHLSVREYLEVKNVEGRLIFSPEEAHAEVALTCLLYWKISSQRSAIGDQDDGSDLDNDNQDDQNEEERDALSISESRESSSTTQTTSDDVSQGDNPLQDEAESADHEIVEQRKAVEGEGVNESQAEAKPGDHNIAG
jgi:hypothetical protein